VEGLHQRRICPGALVRRVCDGAKAKTVFAQAVCIRKPDGMHSGWTPVYSKPYGSAVDICRTVHCWSSSFQ
jgi:hypothetical protein